MSGAVVAAEVTREQALTELFELGAHFVLCRNKIPFEHEWQHRRPSLDDVLRQGDKGVGLLPYSLGLVAVDVDVEEMNSESKANDAIPKNLARLVRIIHE